MVSGSISPRYSRYFSPFLHSTGSLSVSQEYLALPDGAGRFPQGVSDLAVLRIPLSYHYLLIRSSHALWQVSHPVLIHFDIHIVVLQPRLCRNIAGLGFFPFARHYSGNHCCFLFLCLLRCFSSAGSRIYATILQIVRFPHSEIRGSIHIC